MRRCDLAATDNPTTVNARQGWLYLRVWSQTRLAVTLTRSHSDPEMTPIYVFPMTIF